MQKQLFAMFIFSSGEQSFLKAIHIDFTALYCDGPCKSNFCSPVFFLLMGAFESKKYITLLYCDCTVQSRFLQSPVFCFFGFVKAIYKY